MRWNRSVRLVLRSGQSITGINAVVEFMTRLSGEKESLPFVVWSTEATGHASDSSKLIKHATVPRLRTGSNLEALGLNARSSALFFLSNLHLVGRSSALLHLPALLRMTIHLPNRFLKLILTYLVTPPHNSIFDLSLDVITTALHIYKPYPIIHIRLVSPRRSSRLPVTIHTTI